MTYTPTKFYRALAAAACAALVAVPVSGQTAGDANAPGHFLARAAISIASVRQRCPELGDETYAANVRQIGTCEKLGLTALGAAGGHGWYAALFGKRWLLADSGKTPADTAAESEIVLFITDTTRTSGRDTLLTPVWHYRFSPEMVASVRPELVSIDDGALVAIDECVNGTGGCAQSFFVRRRNRSTVVRSTFLDSLNRRFPRAINHGFHVDLKTLRADAAVYSPNDPNCCPSRVAEMRVRLRGERLEMVELRVRPAGEK